MIHDWWVTDAARVGVGGLVIAYDIPSPFSAS